MNALVITRGVENNLVERVLEGTNFFIEYAFVGSEKEKFAIIDNPRVKNVYVCADAALWNENDISELDYTTISEYKDLEADFFDGTNRYVNDYNTVKLLYYNALGFWLKLFKFHKFDVVIMQEITHGVTDDIIPIGIAKKNKIPCYQLEILAEQTGMIYFNNTYEYISLVNDSNVDFFTIPHYVLNTEFNRTPYSGLVASLRYRFRNLIYKLCGQIGIGFFRCLKNRSFEIEIFNHPTTVHTYLDNLISYMIMVKNHNYLKANAVKPNFNTKYIVYYLHVEPEASIMVRCPIKTQLLAIEMLAKSLPSGYKLYVKEHPHQFLMNKEVFWDNLYTMPHYKTKKFYNAIISMPNTYLVDESISSEEMNRHAKAIATYHGTVALEAVLQQKVVMLFAKSKSYFFDSSMVLGISSLSECEKAMQKIDCGYKPNYNFDSFVKNKRKYVYKGDKLGLILALKSIETHFIRRNK